MSREDSHEREMSLNSTTLTMFDRGAAANIAAALLDSLVDAAVLPVDRTYARMTRSVH